MRWLQLLSRGASLFFTTRNINQNILPVSQPSSVKFFPHIPADTTDIMYSCWVGALFVKAYVGPVVPPGGPDPEVRSLWHTHCEDIDVHIVFPFRRLNTTSLISIRSIRVFQYPILSMVYTTCESYSFAKYVPVEGLSPMKSQN